MDFEDTLAPGQQYLETKEEALRFAETLVCNVETQRQRVDGAVLVNNTLLENQKLALRYGAALGGLKALLKTKFLAEPAYEVLLNRAKVAFAPRVVQS